MARAFHRGSALVFLLIAGITVLTAQKPTTPEEMEDFLRTATIGPRRAINVGVTNTQRASLTKGGFQHDCHIQNVDISKPQFTTDRGTELNFRDTYKFNIAAYRLNKLLGLNMFPPYIERKVDSKSSAVGWWIEDAMMEGQRLKKKIEAPDPDRWNKQMYIVRIFDELIYDNDPNVGNFLIDPNWKIWMIDKTRAFRLSHDLRNPKNLVQCERRLLPALKRLDEATLTQEMKGYLTRSEIRSLLVRRDKIVQFFEGEIQSKGENNVLYDLAEIYQP